MFAWLYVSGCAEEPVPKPTWDEARAACDLAEGEAVPLPWDDEGTRHPLSLECATTLGNAVGLDWATAASRTRWTRPWRPWTT